MLHLLKKNTTAIAHEHAQLPGILKRFEALTLDTVCLDFAMLTCVKTVTLAATPATVVVSARAC